MSIKSVQLAGRIAGILQKLNTGITVSVRDLAIEFGVSERTIQKDLNERLDPGLIEPLGNGNYKLVQGYLGQLTIEDIKEFSELSGIIDLYPDINDVVRKKLRDTLIVKSRVNKGCIPNSSIFTEVNKTILEKRKLRFRYNDKEVQAEPYKLLNHNGIWYLMAMNNAIIKSYCLHKMLKVRSSIDTFSIDSSILKTIESNPSPWFRESKTKVVLLVEKEFTDYFIDRNILEGKESFTTNNDGTLTVILMVNSLEEIKGTIKFWLPNIKVIEPESLKDSIVKDIKKFL